MQGEGDKPEGVSNEAASLSAAMAMQAWRARVRRVGTAGTDAERDARYEGFMAGWAAAARSFSASIATIDDRRHFYARLILATALEEPPPEGPPS